MMNICSEAMIWTSLIIYKSPSPVYQFMDLRGRPRAAHDQYVRVMCANHDILDRLHDDLRLFILSLTLDNGFCEQRTAWTWFMFTGIIISPLVEF